MIPAVIIGTGRCGSTMLSNLLNRHSEILSISELFSGVADLGGAIHEIFSEELLEGPLFWQKMSAITPRRSLLIKHGVDYSETLYPYDQEGMRYSAETGVPTILHIVLPHLTDDFEAIFDELSVYFQNRPLAKMVDHYNDLFSWLARRFGKSICVERSGGIVIGLDLVLDAYPNSKYVHIVRDGRNVALSMSEHEAFRMFLLGKQMTEYLGNDPFVSTDRRNIDKLPVELQRFLPEVFNAKAFSGFRFPPSVNGELWSAMVGNTVRMLEQLPKESVLTISYEAFCHRPEYYLEKLIKFLGAGVDTAWVEESAKMVRPSASSWQSLSDEQQAALTKACAPGFAALQNVLPSDLWEYYSE